MSTNREDLYVFVDNDNYRLAKSQMLESQADLLKIMKHMQNMRFLSRQKADLKIQLHTLFEMLVGETNLMEKNLPKPSFIGISNEEKMIKEPKEEIDYSKHDAIDRELQEINEKLKILNS